MDLLKIRMTISAIGSLFGFESWLLQPEVMTQFMPVVVIVILISAYDLYIVTHEGVHTLQKCANHIFAGGNQIVPTDWTLLDDGRRHQS